MARAFKLRTQNVVRMAYLSAFIQTGGILQMQKLINEADERVCRTHCVTRGTGKVSIIFWI
jgi:hypothetical protein